MRGKAKHKFVTSSTSALIIKLTLAIGLCVLLLVPRNGAQAAGKELVFSAFPGSMYAAVSIPVVKEAYKRIGISVTISTRPAKRAIFESSTGVTDGEVNRIAKVAKLYPSLLPVGGPIIALRGIAFVIGKKPAIRNWQDLRPYRIGVVRGIVFSNKPTQGMNRFQAKDPRHLFKLLVFDRIDIAITSALNGRFTIGKYFPGKKIRALNPPLIDISTFHFLHEKHRSLIPVVAKSLDAMKKSGRIEEIINNVITNMISAKKE